MLWNLSLGHKFLMLSLSSIQYLSSCLYMLYIAHSEIVIKKFCILLTVHLGRILVNNQLDALSLMILFIYFTSVHVSNSTVFIIRRSIVLTFHLVCISLCRWLSGMPVRIFPPDRIPGSHLHRLIHTRWRVNTRKINLLMMNTVLFETCTEVK